jgi:hypothetical protein
MVRGRHGGKRRDARGGGVMPLVASTPEGSTPRETNRLSAGTYNCG